MIEAARRNQAKMAMKQKCGSYPTVHRTVRWFGLLLVLGVAILLSNRTVQADNACYLYSAEVGYVCDQTPETPVFVAPDAYTRTLASRTTYGRKQNHVNVHPVPDVNSSPLYNRGAGFLFVTIRDQVQANGEKWYQIGPGEYVQASKVAISRPSQMQGMKIARNPDQPFGWIVGNVHPSRTPGGEPDPDLPRMLRYDFFQVYNAAEPGDGWVWYDVGPNQWIRQTFVSLVEPSPRPEGVGEADYWVEVDLYEQTFAAYVGDQMVYGGLISTGLPKYDTREGLFQVWARHVQAKMSGLSGRPEYYYLQNVPHIMYFDKDIGLHGAYWHNRFGYRASRGCVNMTPGDAEWVFNWSRQAPNRLWVWVHSSDPRDYFVKYRVTPVAAEATDVEAASGAGSQEIEQAPVEPEMMSWH
jgi:lipoprotein-anchoring transpeptidase ErfK/SrfK